MPSFDVAGARKAGYDDKEILSYVAGEENPDLIPGTDAEKIRLLLARNGKHMLDVEYLSPTQLEPMQEVQFQDWAKRNKVRLEPGYNEDYDMRGLWKSNPGAAPDPQGQWPGTYKLPNHPTFSSQSIYALPELPAPKLPQGLSGPPASIPGSVPQTGERRNLTPQEADALWSEQGIESTLPPFSPADLAMLGLSGPVESAGLPPTLLQMVRYKKPGVSALAQEAAAAYHQRPRVDPIGAKNTVFHATNPETVGTILKAGEIVPGRADIKDPGVSVSRVPRALTKGTRAVSFVIDPEKIPSSRPYVEPLYEKTFGKNAAPWQVDEYHRPRMNPRFEFEDRTYGEAIPTSAVRELWVDKSAIGSDPLSWGIGAERPQDIADRLRNLAQEYGIPLREFQTGREMHAGRATLSNMAKKKLPRNRSVATTFEDKVNYSGPYEPSPFPQYDWRKHDFTVPGVDLEQSLKQGQRVSVPLSELNSQQARVRKLDLEHVTAEPHPPVVVKKGGKLWIQDGHHRLAQAYARGDKEATVIVVDKDKR